MTLSIQFALVIGLLALATIGGLIWKAKTGTAKKISQGEIIDLKEIRRPRHLPSVFFRSVQPVRSNGKAVSRA
jgi:hypothetical protein